MYKLKKMHFFGKFLDTESLGIFVTSVKKDREVEKDGQIYVGGQIIAVSVSAGSF